MSDRTDYEDGPSPGPSPSPAAGLRTFSNKCLAGCAGAAVIHQGPCIGERRAWMDSMSRGMAENCRVGKAEI